MNQEYDYIIIGAGIIGLSIARSLLGEDPRNRILIIEKEKDVAEHASSRNSGVLHAGFYYTADSLKAKFTVAGNKTMKEYCRTKDLPINACGKIVVAQNPDELKTLHELEKRGKINGSNISLIDEQQVKEIDPNVKTFQKAIYSPDTASINPKLICEELKKDLSRSGVHLQFETAFMGNKSKTISTTKGEFSYKKKIVNCAGLYADQIAHRFGFGRQYTIIPFKGIYLKYTKNKTDIKVNVYPVPNLRNPFLGVHFTKTVGGDIKIGPTAIPAFWRENYGGLDNFKFNEMASILFNETKLFLTNAFHFRDLAREEMKKYDKNYFVQLASNLVHEIDPKGFTEFTAPGIRAQLLDITKRSLVQDFVIEADKESIHVLNAVSPAFTCAFPFAEFVCQNYILK